MTEGVLPREMTDREGGAYTVRRLTPADRDALEQMYADFTPRRCAQGLPPDSEPALRRWLDRVIDVGWHLGVEIDGRLLGHVMLIPIGEDTAELANFLHQSARNRGIGTAVNRMALELARTAGARRVWLSVEPSNRAALRSYRNAGFSPLPGSLWAPEVEMEVVLV